MDIPKSVKGATRRIWRELAPIVGERLSAATVQSFVQLCTSVAAYHAINEAVSEIPTEELVIEHSNGTLGLHPLERVRTQRNKEMRTALRDWGLSPDTVILPEDDTVGEFVESLKGNTSMELPEIMDALLARANELEAQGRVSAAEKMRKEAEAVDCAMLAEFLKG